MKASSLMFIAIGLMAVDSCAVNIGPSQIGSNTVTDISFTATFGDSQSTKTAVQSDGATIWWNPHEDINIFYGNSESSKFTSTNEEAVAKAHFKGTIEAFTGETESGEPNSFWAIYPYDTENTCDGMSVTLTIPANQIAKADTFSDKQWTTLARSQGLALSFYAVGAGFRFSVTEAGITSVSFRGNNNEVLAGKAKITMDSNNRPIIQEYISPVTEITLTAPAGETLAVGPLYYMAFFPQNFEQGFSVTFHTATATGTRNYDKAINFKRTDVHRGKNFDADVTYATILPNNELWYTSVDGYSVKPRTDNWGESILSYDTTYGDYIIITFSGPITKVPYNAFYEKTKLRTIYLPDGVRTVDGSAFLRCNNLLKVVLPNTLERIEYQAFFGCSSLSDISIPTSVTEIAGYAFAGCAFSSIILPDNVTLREGVFSQNTSLRSVILPANIETIPSELFWYCTNLESVVIPVNVSSIGGNAFSDCSSLTSITVLPITPPEGGRNMFNSTNNCPIYVPAESVDEYKIAPYWSEYANRIRAIPE